MGGIILKGSNRPLAGTSIRGLSTYGVDAKVASDVQGGLNQLTDALRRMDNRRKDAELRDVLATSQQRATAFNTELYRKKGKDAIQAGPEAQAGLEEIMKEGETAFTGDPRQQRAFRDNFQNTVLSGTRSGYSHQRQETDNYARNTLVMDSKANLDAAVLNPNDTKEVDRMVELNKENAWEQYKMTMGQEADTKQKPTVELAASTEIYSAIVDAQATDSATLALNTLDVHRKDMDPEVYFQKKRELELKYDNEIAYTAAASIMAAGDDLEKNIEEVDKIEGMSDRQKAQTKKIILSQTKNKEVIRDLRRTELMRSEYDNMKRMPLEVLYGYDPGSSPKHGTFYTPEDYDTMYAQKEHLLAGMISARGGRPQHSNVGVKLAVKGASDPDLLAMDFETPFYYKNLNEKDLSEAKDDQKKVRDQDKSIMGKRNPNQLLTSFANKFSDFNSDADTGDDVADARLRRKELFLQKAMDQVEALPVDKRTTENVNEIRDFLTRPVHFGGFLGMGAAKVYNFELDSIDDDGVLPWEDKINQLKPAKSHRPENLKKMKNLTYDKNANVFIQVEGGETTYYDRGGTKVDKLVGKKGKVLYERKTGSTYIYWNPQGRIEKFTK